LTIQGLVVWAIISRSSQKNAESDLLIYVMSKSGN